MYFKFQRHVNRRQLHLFANGDQTRNHLVHGEQLVSPTLSEREPLGATVKFPSSVCEERHAPRDAFASSYMEYYTAGSLKHRSYVSEYTRKRQNKFANSF